jgi:SAM-dependent methyltransferase
VIVIDVSEGMLRRAPHEIDRVAADMMQMPLGDATIDGAFSTFALQHAPRARDVFKEVARALRPGGFFATATWGSDHSESGGSYDVLNEVFRRHRVPSDEAAMQTWHDRVDEPQKLERLARGARLVVERAWTQRSTFHWTPRRFLGWATTMGPYGRRLANVSQQLRARVAMDLQNDLEQLEDDAFRWTPECVYSISVKP